MSIVQSVGTSTATLTADFNSFEIETSQSVEDVTPYGSNKMAKNVGSGTPTMMVTVGAFALKGASTSPEYFGVVSSAVMGGGGATCTFTLDSSLTETGTFVIERKRLTHARMRAAVPLTLTLRNYGDITETWVTS